MTTAGASSSRPSSAITTATIAITAPTVGALSALAPIGAAFGCATDARRS
jgi:hypothetical protein